LAAAGFLHELFSSVAPPTAADHSLRQRPMLRRLQKTVAERGLRRSLDLVVRRLIDWRSFRIRRAIELRPHQRRALLQRLTASVSAARLTLIVPVSGPSAGRLIAQLRRQSFARFQVLLIPDDRLDHRLLLQIRRQAARDPRFSLLPPADLRRDPLAIAAARAHATTPYVVFCDAAAQLANDAVALLTAASLESPAPTVVYGDDDSSNAFGLPERPRLRPAWSLHHLRERDYVDLPLLVDRTLVAALPDPTAVDRAGALLELLLYAAEQPAARLQHLPYRLARRPRPYRPAPRSPQTERILSAHLARCAVDARLSTVADRSDLTRVDYALPQPPPPVTIIVPTRDRLDLLRPCVESLLQHTAYPDFELIIVDNGSTEPATAAFFASLQRDPRVRVLRDDGEFNYAALNNRAAAVARGSLLCLLNNDTEIIEADWLTQLVSLAVQPGVATVGPLLLYPDNTIQCMGVTTGPVYPATTIGTGDPDYQRRHNLLWCTRGVIANTAACLVVRTALFLADRGFDPQLKVDFNDVELGLRLHRQGYVNLWTPHVRVIHRHGATRGRRDNPQVLARRMAEAAYLSEHYPELIGHDPFFRTVGPQSHRPPSLRSQRGCT
jgi:O-antigen biosynthesis protein